MRIFKINGKTYKAKPFGYNFLSDLDEQGIRIQNTGQMSLIRLYFAYCADIDKETAGELIEKHLLDGGDLNSISDALGTAMEESDFFRLISQMPEEGVEQNPEEEQAEETLAE